MGSKGLARRTYKDQKNVAVIILHIFPDLGVKIHFSVTFNYFSVGGILKAQDLIPVISHFLKEINILFDILL